MITKDISKLISRGSFGTVYKGVVADTEVAVKVIDPVSFNPLIYQLVIFSLCRKCSKTSGNLHFLPNLVHSLSMYT